MRVMFDDVAMVDLALCKVVLFGGRVIDVTEDEARGFAVRICRGGAPIAPAPAPPRQPTKGESS